MANIHAHQKALMGKKDIYIRRITPYLYIAPAFILIAIFLVAPFYTALTKAFYRYDLVNVDEFVGIQNFVKLFTSDPKFLISLRNLLYILAGFLVCFQFPLIAAKLTHSLASDRLQYWFRSFFMIPLGVPGIVSLFMWKFIYYPEVGALSRILGFFNVAAPNMLGNPRFVMIAIILMGFPWVAGLNYIINFAALQEIDISISDAADLDGAGYFAKFFRVELPLIMPQLKALLILGLIGTVQDYERFLLLTGGGPMNRTLVPGLHMFNMAFGRGEANYGYACAISLVLLAINLLGVSLFLKFGKSEED